MVIKEPDETFYHVLHSKQDGRWHLKAGNEAGSVASYPSKEAAIEEATRLAQLLKNQKRHVIVHKTNGAFEDVKHFDEIENG